MKPGTRVRTVEPLGYRRPGQDVSIAPAGMEGVVVEPDKGDPPKTFQVMVDMPGSEHDKAVIPWVMAVQVEEI